MIHAGYEVGTGRAISIPLRHTAVFGQTQESGKTTTLEAWIYRSGLRGLAFVTKRGESSFHVMNPIKPYFRERTDWRFVAAILEATLSEKLKFQRSWIMKLCAAGYGKKSKVEYSWPVPRTLADVQSNVQTALMFATGMNESVYTELAEYLKEIIPQIERLPYTVTLDLKPGVNVMDLTSYDFPLQALVVRSCMEWIRKREREVVVVVPESHKFAPKQRGSPVKLEAEDFIREAAALKNFLWIDCQDVAGVADVLLRQVGVWAFGVQRAKHEIQRTLDAIPAELDVHRPSHSEIAKLGKGQFFVAWGREMYKVYIQPAWMSAAHAEAIARGEEEVTSASEVLKQYSREHKPEARKPQAGRQANASQAADRIVPDLSNPAGGIDHHQDSLQSAKADAREGDKKNTNRAAPPEEAMRDTAYEELFRKYQNLSSEFEKLHTTYDELIALQKGSSRSSAADASGATEKLTPAARKGKGREGAASSKLGTYAPSNNGGESLHPEDLDAIYAFVKRRASNDPGILQVLMQKPEMHIEVAVPVLKINGDSLFGRIAQLVQGKFFAQPRPLADVVKECVRRGACHPKTPFSRIQEPLMKLTSLGFLSWEGASGWQQVPSMKITIEESD